MKVTGRPTVLVTGASAGLGLALSKRLLPRSYRLILTARASSLPRFETVGICEEEFVHLRPLDVTNPEERAAIVAEANERWGGIDILVNNAGLAYRSVVEHVTEEERLEQLNINFRGPIDMVRLVLPGMRAKRAGRIINVSSVGGMLAMPTMAIYSASKYALEGATEALWYEMRPWGIRVTLVEPGFIHSDSFLNTRFTDLGRQAISDAADPYHQHYLNMDRLISKLMRRALATPDSIARRIVRLMEQRRPPLRVYATIDAHVFALLRRFLPREMFHHFLYSRLPSVEKWGKG